MFNFKQNHGGWYHVWLHVPGKRWERKRVQGLAKACRMASECEHTATVQYPYGNGRLFRNLKGSRNPHPMVLDRMMRGV